MPYRYNDRNRLDELTVGSTVTADYTYDGLERLAIRTTQNMTPAGTTHYVYDLTGHPIAEATDTGSTVREYVWLDDMPLAVVADVDTPAPHLYYVHADHLDRPLKMTDGSEAVVWDAIYKPFGEAYSITGSAANNLRFPGQYFLLESGLAYNWYRHYDPTLGRYTQPDPLGVMMDGKPVSSPVLIMDVKVGPRLAGLGKLSRGMVPLTASGMPEFANGPSIYAYAKSNPLSNIDPNGLQIAPVVRGGAWGIAVLCSRYPALCAGTAAAAVQVWNYCRDVPTHSGDDDKQHCEELYQIDTDTCNAISRRRGARAGAVCHASASERYSACLSGRYLPPLNTWNN